MATVAIHCVGCSDGDGCRCVRTQTLTPPLETEYVPMPYRVLLNTKMQMLFPPGFATIVGWLTILQHPATWASIATQGIVTLGIGVLVALAVRVFTIAVLDKYLPLKPKYTIKMLPDAEKVPAKKVPARRKRPPTVK